MFKDLDSVLLKLTTILEQRKLLIATAESCTGGLIASFLTQFPGSSAWFERGFVTYSNLAKQEMLGVDEALIRSQGAVSEDVAKAMAEGALRNSAALVSLSVTGIAGPSGGSPSKPVGTVCFAWGLRGQALQSTHCHFLKASRQEIRMLACRQAFLGMITVLES